MCVCVWGGTLTLGVEGWRQDSGDCMSTGAGSESDGRFFLGILNGASMLGKGDVGGQS